MHRVLLLGGGKIGRMIAKLLAPTGDYDVTLADVDETSLARARGHVDVRTRALDARRLAELRYAMRDCDSVVSALSFRYNPGVAQTALDVGASYFDLTEDITTTRLVRQLAERARPGQIFMPQCGLAPGFVSIAAYHLTMGCD